MAAESEYDIKQPKFTVSKTQIDAKIIKPKLNNQVKIKKFVSSSSNKYYPKI